MRSLEIGSHGFEELNISPAELKAKLQIPNAEALVCCTGAKKWNVC